MTIVLAALDASAAARPVLETALGVAELTGATVEAVHVRDGSADTPASTAARAGVPFRVLDGSVEEALLDALATPDVVAAVVGARSTSGGRQPAGHIAMRVVARATKPVVVVPPEVVGSVRRPFERLLIPLEGTEASSRSIAAYLWPLLAHEVEFVVLHVFTPETVPRVLDRPGRDLELLGDEFLARHCPRAGHIELRTGAVGTQVAALCAAEAVDMIVLSWSQDISPGRAAVIREVVGHALVPVVLLPVDSLPDDGDGAPDARPAVALTPPR